MKTVLFVPGFQEDIASRDYAKTISAIEKCGYLVEFVGIDWMRTTIEDWVDELNRTYAAYNPRETILAGFSYGAMTAFVAAVNKAPSELWLFSLSPYFAEDLKSNHMKLAWLNNIGYRRVKAFAKLNFTELSKSIDCKTSIFAGQLEIEKWPGIGNRVSEANELLLDASLTIVRGAGHDVTHKMYIQEITKAI